MSSEQQARKMFTSIAKATGGLEYAGEFYTACRGFLSGTDPTMPSKALIPPNEQNIDRLVKVTGGSSKIYTGEGLITKAKRDRAELQNCYMPLLTNVVVRTYPNIGSGKNWEQIQEDFRLRLWQERCRALLNENMKEIEKALKDEQGRLQSFDDATKFNPPHTGRTFEGSSRGDVPPLLRPVEGPHLAAHMRAAAGASQSRRGGHKQCRTRDATSLPGCGRRRARAG